MGLFSVQRFHAPEVWLLMGLAPRLTIYGPPATAAK
jgi:hypothetical protein